MDPSLFLTSEDRSATSVSPSPPVLSSEVVKALTSEIISDRPMTASPSPSSHSANPAHLPIKPSRDLSSGAKKPLGVAPSATHTKRLNDETTRAPRKKTDPSSLVSSRGRGSNPTEIEGGSELDSFLRRKKEGSSGGVGKKTVR
jgi:hypothetical protein